MKPRIEKLFKKPNHEIVSFLIFMIVLNMFAVLLYIPLKLSGNWENED